MATLGVVHGSRDPETSKVEQEILFTIYSKPEAREVLGRDGGEVDLRFRHWLEDQWPRVRFDWRKIRQGVEDGIDGLPDSHDYQSARAREQFRPALREFTRQLVLNEPTRLVSSWSLIREHRIELEFLRDLITSHLDVPAPTPDHAEWMEDNPFHWRYVMSSFEVSPDLGELIDGVYESGDLDRAERLYSLLTEIFEGFADGYNGLGGIACDRGDYESAIERFQRAIETGHARLPKRVVKDQWWTDLRTRPYMRGLRNLAMALNFAARHHEALRVCESLDRCRDTLHAEQHRAAACLALGEWEAAAQAARVVQDVSPLESLVGAFAELEAGDEERARVCFLHAVMNYPVAVGEILGQRRGIPASWQDSPATAAALAQSIRGFLSSRTQASKRFFEDLWKRSEPLRDEVARAIESWERDRGEENREAFHRVCEMSSLDFAERTWGDGARPDVEP